MTQGVRPPESLADPEALLKRESANFANFLAAAAGTLFLLYAIIVALPLLPPRPLDPAWLLRFSSTLADNGALALMGVALVFLAHHIHPNSQRLRARRAWVAGLSRWAAYGFLLLIPLQLLASLNGLQTVQANQLEQLRRSERDVARVRDVVKRAPSTTVLQAQLQQLQAPQLLADELVQPLPAVKSRYLKNLAKTEQDIKRELRNPFPPGLILFLLQTTLKGIALSIGFALGFAAAAPGKTAEFSLLSDWKQGWSRFGKRSKSGVPQIGGGKLDEFSSYYDHALDSEER